MAWKIWKFTLRGGEENNYFVEMPAGGVVLSCGWQGIAFVVWAMVHPSNPVKMRKFHVAGTGHDLSHMASADNLVGRVDVGPHDAPMIFHVFDLGW